MVLPFRTLLSIAAWLYAITTSVLLFFGALAVFAVTAPFDSRRRALHRLGSFWAFHYIQVIPAWSATIRGVEQVGPHDTVIYAANHQSMVDILAIFGLRRHFKWVAKQSVFAVPFIGWNARLNNYVGIRRGSPLAMEQMLRECGAHLRRGSSVFFFPEGTRSRDGGLLPFKSGPFRLAVETGTPVVPVVISGTRDILEKNDWMLPVWKTVNITVEVLPPVHPEQAGGDQERLKALVRQAMFIRLNTQREQGELSHG